MKTDIRNILASKTKQALSSNILNTDNIRQNILVLDELKSLIPPLSVEEYSQLESNILQHGCQTPIQVWQTSKKKLALPFEQDDDLAYVLIDGHNRQQICKSNNLPFEVYMLSFDSLKDAKDYMINLQLGRRNLSPAQISYFRGLRYNNEKADKTDNLKSNLSKGHNDLSENMNTFDSDSIETYNKDSSKGHNDLSENMNTFDSDSIETYNKDSSKGHNDLSGITTADKLAKEYNVSPKTIKRDAEYAGGLEKIEPELKNLILNGKTKIEKKIIQKLSKSLIEKPVSSIEELYALTQSSESIDLTSVEIRHKNLSSIIRKSVKNASNSDLTVQIKGSFLVKNGLEEIWKELRGLSNDIIIDKNYTDTISIYEAPSLGILEMI